MKNVSQRIENALFGLALGDALSWQSLYHRAYDLPFWTRRLRREIDVESENAGIIRLNLPFSLNCPVESFKMSPTDDTEWAAFTINQILKQQEYNNDKHIEAWKSLSESNETIRGSVSVIGAIKNFQKGLLPPETGSDNPHYFDDAAMTRGIVIGLCFKGDTMEAFKQAGMNASITNSLDGVWAAQSIASAVSVACNSDSVDEVIKTAIDSIPIDSWLYQKVNKAIDIAGKNGSLLGALPDLHDEIIDHSYNYGTSAPDNLALALAIFKLCEGEITLGITSSTSLAKTADSVPSFVGALCGALRHDPLDTSWINRMGEFKGICVPEMKGVNYKKMVSEFNELICNKQVK